MKIPSYVENDPWLKPFAPAIVGRLEYVERREKELLQETMSFDSFANGHLFFGCHKTDSCWIFRYFDRIVLNFCFFGSLSIW